MVEAAKEVQKQDNWKDVRGVNNLALSSNWVSKFLRRANMRRRTITTEDKKIPSVDEIVRIMRIGQDMYKEFDHSPETVINMDETGYCYALGPKHLYCPPNQDRAQHLGVPNIKLRITAVVAVSGTGVFVPLFIIIKHSVGSEERPDQSSMRVIQDLHRKNDGFGNDHGWDLHLWEKTLCIKSITADHKCYYIIHRNTGEVITSQFKAWNDSIRMIMWLETVVGPLKRRLNKLMIWFDNCGCHKTDIVDVEIARLGVQVACLPPNMTGVLQVLDLVVNGPIKAHTRNLRGARTVAAFGEHKKLYDIEMSKSVLERVLPVFKPPKPDMLQAIKDVFNLMANGFTEPKFVQGIVRSFISTGCIPMVNDDNTNVSFQLYTKHKVSGTINFKQFGIVQSDTTDENSEVVNAINAMLDYDSDDDASAAMRFILDYNFDDSENN